MSEPIRISAGDLEDARIDLQLAEQRSFGFGGPDVVEKKTPLWLRPWLALTVAGLAGALIAWGIMEPLIDDGVRFQGQVESVSTDLPVDANLHVSELLVVSGIRVLVPREALILDEEGRRAVPEQIRTGDSLEILCYMNSDEDGHKVGAAHFLRKLKRAGEPLPPPDLSATLLRKGLANLALFPLIASMVGMFVGAADGVISRAWLRALVSAMIGAAVGLLAGIVAMLAGELIFAFARGIALNLDRGNSLKFSGTSLLVLIMGRGLAWSVIGLAVGLGQGIAMRSWKLLLNGVLGGSIGALMGGVLFDPINLAFENWFRTGGAELSRMVGLGLIGAATGLMIGLVELVAREAWVKLLTGPIAGKEFILYRNPTWIGSSPKCEIYLFKDAQVAPRHAAIHRAGEHYEIEDQGAPAGTLLSGVAIKRRRLRDRNRIQIGQTTIEFRLKDE